MAMTKTEEALTELTAAVASLETEVKMAREAHGEQLAELFDRSHGRYDVFKYEDNLDYAATYTNCIIALTTGDTTTQLVKTYHTGETGTWTTDAKDLQRARGSASSPPDSSCSVGAVSSASRCAARPAGQTSVTRSTPDVSQARPALPKWTTRPSASSTPP